MQHVLHLRDHDVAVQIDNDAVAHRLVAEDLGRHRVVPPRVEALFVPPVAPPVLVFTVRRSLFREVHL